MLCYLPQKRATIEELLTVAKDAIKPVPQKHVIDPSYEEIIIEEI